MTADTPTIDHSHDPALSTWLGSAQDHADFPIQNLPLGIFSPADDSERRAGTAIGDHILDLCALAENGLLGLPDASVLYHDTLNALLAKPAAYRIALRHRLVELLTNEIHRAAVEPALYPASACTMHLPARIGDYTDFFSGIHHATNAGRFFRPDNPLLPNYRYVPIGYHGRASSIGVSGTSVRRPRGQLKSPDDAQPSFSPSRKLDFEIELGLWIGEGNRAGEPIPIASASKHLAGLCLLNDWSARDIQAWEYQPLGPFLAKSFGTTISPWIVTAEALAPFRIPQGARVAEDPAPLPYLWSDEDQRCGAFSIEIEASITTDRMRQNGMPAHLLARTTADNMYWTAGQLIAHHSSNGCNLRSGDLLGTGTISSASPAGLGSLLEISHNGQRMIELPSGEARYFLDDGDEIRLTARAVAPGRKSIGFGECVGKILGCEASG